MVVLLKVSTAQNSMQNPKLPDWAVVDAAGPPPSATLPGAVLGAGFMDERWQVA
jgi:hypothetical protein